MRTSIETCYQRTLSRWKTTHEFNEEEFNKFAERKKGMFKWYKGLNKFIEEIDKL